MDGWLVRDRGKGERAIVIFKPGGFGWQVLGDWELPQYSFLSPAKLALGLQH